MRILFDQGTPVAIRDRLENHSVRTANAQGWSTLTNGELLRVAERAGFEVLLTTDTSLPHQQNLEGRKLAVVILTRNPLGADQAKNGGDRGCGEFGEGWNVFSGRYSGWRKLGLTRPY